MLQKYDTNLNAATTRFWNSLYFNDNDVLENLLAPDCHIMLKSTGTGCIGIIECLKILKDIQNKMSIFESEKGKLRFTMKLNKIKRSARFLITPIDSTLKFNLGFQLEWECGIVIGIKIVEDPSPGFLVIKKSGKSLSDIQNSVLRQQTGPSHHEWRAISKTKVAAFVLPKDFHKRYSNSSKENNNNGNKSTTTTTTTTEENINSIDDNNTLESKIHHLDFERNSDSTEIHYIQDYINDNNNNNNNEKNNENNIDEENNNDNNMDNNSITSTSITQKNINKSDSNEIYIYPGDEIISTSELTSPTNVNNTKIKFSPYTTALLVPDRLELPSKDLFYNASDFQLFAIDYGDEIKEIMMTKRVSPQQAIAIYHSLPLNTSQIPPNTNDETQLITNGNEENKNDSNINDDLDPINNDDNNNGKSTTPSSIPPILVSSLKADVEQERAIEKQRRDTLSTELTQPKRGWYPGKILGIIKNTITGDNTDRESESQIRPPSIPSVTSSAAAISDKDGWYPGKFLGRIRSSTLSKRVSYDETNDFNSTDNSDQKVVIPSQLPSSPISEGFNDLMQTHSSSGSSPKFFIAITVIGCNNLKSPLKRVITRPINSSVQVIVGDESQATEIISNNRNPRYRELNTFMFAIQPNNSTEGFIEFIVTHKGIFDFEIIGVVRLPFVGISMQKDCQNPDHILLPLTSRTSNIYTIGKGYHKFSSSELDKNIEYPSLDNVVFHDTSGVDYKGEEVPSLYVRVHKVNIRQLYNQN